MENLVAVLTQYRDTYYTFFSAFVLYMMELTEETELKPPTMSGRVSRGVEKRIKDGPK